MTVYVDVPNSRVKNALKVAREKHRVKNTDEDLNRNKKGKMVVGFRKLYRIK